MGGTYIVVFVSLMGGTYIVVFV